MTWGPFQTAHCMASECLGQVHSDMCGPLKVPSLGKKWYFCILVDDKTCYLWYHPCALKSDFTPWFTGLDKLFFNHYSSHVKTLHTDREGEYVNAALEGYCANNRIHMELMVLL